MTFPPARLYREDRPLIQKLGLQTDVNLPHGERVELGSYEHRHDGVLWATINVAVTALPAQFWEFTITPGEVEDVKPVKLATGSGAFRDYWPTVLLFANACLTVEAPK